MTARRRVTIGHNLRRLINSGPSAALRVKQATGMYSSDVDVIKRREAI